MGNRRQLQTFSSSLAPYNAKERLGIFQQQKGQGGIDKCLLAVAMILILSFAVVLIKFDGVCNVLLVDELQKVSLKSFKPRGSS